VDRPKGRSPTFALEETQRKEAKALARDNSATLEQHVGLRLLYEYTDSLPSLGVGEIVKPLTPNARVSAMYCEGVTSFSSAAAQIDSISSVQSRVASPIDHIVQTYTTERSKTLTDEQAIENKRMMIAEVYGAGEHAFFSIVHRDTLVWDSAEGFVMGPLVDGKVLDATRIEASFVDGKFERMMCPDGKKPLPGVKLGRDVVAGELVDGNVHVHSGISVINSGGMPGRFLKARPLSNFFMRLSKATKNMEVKARMVDDEPGLYRVAHGLDGLRVEVTGHKQWAALHREKADQRKSEQATQLMAEFDTPQTITERLQVELRETLAKIHERGERPLMSTVHNVAAKYYVSPERDESGKLMWRLMRQAEKGRGDGQWVDSAGIAHVRTARWVVTDTLLDVDLRMVAPSPADVKANLSQFEMEKHVVALGRRAWLDGLGDAAAAENEYKETLRADPGRVARDLIARGEANFFSHDIAIEIARHVTDHDWGFTWLDHVLNNDKDLVVLSSITPSPLYTTRAQKALTEEFVGRLDARMSALDPSYDPALLKRMIVQSEKEIEDDRRRRAPNAPHESVEFRYTAQQRETFVQIASHSQTVVQGDAGSGKSSAMRVIKNYYNALGRSAAGFSTGQKAAEGLTVNAGFDARNFAMAKTLHTHKGVEMVKERSVVVLEEASTLSLADANVAAKHCGEKNATAVFIGDGAQQRSLTSGNTMGLLMHVAHKHGRLVKWTEVFRMSGERVKWLAGSLDDFRKGTAQEVGHPDKGWAAAGGLSIRTEDSAGFERYVREYDRRGHFRYYKATVDEETGEVTSAKKSMMLAIAADVARVTKVGQKPVVILPARSRNDCRIINDAVCTALGFDGTGQRFKFMEGEREIAVGMRIAFKRNSQRSPFRKEADQEIHTAYHATDTTNGVLNGYTGTVTDIRQSGYNITRKGKYERWTIAVDLDNGSKIEFDPAVYRDVDRGYAATKMVNQGAGSPRVISPVTPGDDPNSFHVGATRVSEIDLSLYTTMPNIDAVVDSLSDKLGQDSDAVLFQRIVQQTGGDHTPWAKQVRKMQADDDDPLCRIYRAEMTERLARQGHLVAEIIRDNPKKTRVRDRLVKDAIKDTAVESKVSWAWKYRAMVETEWDLLERVMAQPIRLAPAVHLRREPRDLDDRQKQNLAASLAGIKSISGSPAEAYLLHERGLLDIEDCWYAPNWARGTKNAEGRESRGFGPAAVCTWHDPNGAAVAASARLLRPVVFQDGRVLKAFTVGAISQGLYATAGAWNSPVVGIFEGFIDAKTAAAYGLPSFARGGSNNSPWFMAEALAGKFVVDGMDNDAPGDESSAKLKDLLCDRSEHARLVLPDGLVDSHGDQIKDVNALHTSGYTDDLRTALADAQRVLNMERRVTITPSIHF
jgi:hypothetical protein